MDGVVKLKARCADTVFVDKSSHNLSKFLIIVFIEFVDILCIRLCFLNHSDHTLSL